jgi:hypothetical protein
VAPAAQSVGKLPYFGVPSGWRVIRSERRNPVRTGTLWVGVKQLQLIRWRFSSLRLEGVRRSLHHSVVRSVSGNQIQVGTHRCLPNLRKYPVNVDAIMLHHVDRRPRRKCKTGNGADETTVRDALQGKHRRMTDYSAEDQSKSAY